MSLRVKIHGSSTDWEAKVYNMFDLYLLLEVSVYFILFYRLFAFSKAAAEAYGSSQARGLIRAVAAGLRQSHSNTGSEPCLQPTPQVTATPDPYPTEQGQGPNLRPHGS